MNKHVRDNINLVCYFDAIAAFSIRAPDHIIQWARLHIATYSTLGKLLAVGAVTRDDAITKINHYMRRVKPTGTCSSLQYLPVLNWETRRQMLMVTRTHDVLNITPHDVEHFAEEPPWDTCSCSNPFRIGGKCYASWCTIRDITGMTEAEWREVADEELRQTIIPDLAAIASAYL